MKNKNLEYVNNNLNLINKNLLNVIKDLLILKKEKSNEFFEIIELFEKRYKIEIEKLKNEKSIEELKFLNHELFENYYLFIKTVNLLNQIKLEELKNLNLKELKELSEVIKFEINKEFIDILLKSNKFKLLLNNYLENIKILQKKYANILKNNQKLNIKENKGQNSKKENNIIIEEEEEEDYFIKPKLDLNYIKRSKN